MAKRKPGLHKEISSIFDGVPLPGKPGAMPPAAPEPDHIGYVPTKPIVPRLQVQPTPEPQPPPAKVTAPKQPKAGTITKVFKQIPKQEIWRQIKGKLFTPKPGVSAKRQKVMVILVPVLFIILIFVFIQVFSTPWRRTTRIASFGPTNAVAGSSTEIDWQIPAPYPTAIRDPMQFGSTVTAQAGAGKLIVKGIVFVHGEDRPAAVIGTQIVREGEKILDATIVKINKNSVEFEMNGKRWTQKVER